MGEDGARGNLHRYGVTKCALPEICSPFVHYMSYRHNFLGFFFSKIDPFDSAPDKKGNMG